MSADAAPGSALERRLGTFDAAVIGVGSMVGAGVFSAIGPAAESAGTWLVLGLAVAAFHTFPDEFAVVKTQSLFEVD